MSVYKMKRKDLDAVRKFCAAKGYGRGYKKRLAERVNMAPGSDETSFNFDLWEDNDLWDHSFELTDLVGQEVEANANGVITLDIWVYEPRWDDNVNWLNPSAILVEYRGKQKLVWGKGPEDVFAETLRFAAELKKGA